MFAEFELNTSKREEFKDITKKLQEFITSSNIESGICIIYTPHTTSAITINENADADVCTDILNGLKEIAPYEKNYRHIEGNSDSHIKASLLGSSQTVIIQNAKLKLGTWQGIYFCEFDGPRKRKIWIKIIKD